MKKLLLILALLTPSAAFAQCNGVFPNNTVCGNATGAGNTPRPTSPALFTAAGQKPLYGFTPPPPFSTSANLPSTYAQAPMPVAQNGSSGPGSVTMSIRPSALFHLIQRTIGANDNRAYVDPINGVDTGSTCSASAPCLTLEYCFQNCTATNIVGIPTGPFFPFTFDNTAAVNDTHSLSFTGPATIRLHGAPYIDMSAMTFVADGTAPTVYAASLAITGLQIIHRVVQNTLFTPGTGNLFRLAQYPSLAALRTAANASPSTTRGWFYDGAGNFYVTYAGSDISTTKASFTAYYTDPNGNSQIAVVGAATLLIDTPYQLNLDGVGIYITSSDAIHHPVVLLDGREDMMIRQFVSPSFGTTINGGFLYVDGMDCEASKFDCWNGNPPATGTDIGYMVGSNIRGWFSGDFENYQLLSPTYNSQGWSTHGGVNDIVAGASFGRSLGQNVANISNSGFNSASWLIGVETYLAYPDPSSFSPGFNFVSNDAFSTRTVWLDTTMTMQETNSLYVQFGATAFVTNSFYNVPSQTTPGGTITPYVRNAP